MSSMNNHRRRSRRGEKMKRAAFGSMERRARPNYGRSRARWRKLPNFSFQELMRMMCQGNHGRESRAVPVQAEAAEE